MAAATNSVTTTESPDQERLYLASQWRLMWLKLRRHRLAIASAVVLGLCYFGAAFCEFLAPFDPAARHVEYIHAPPQRVRFFDRGLVPRPFVYGATVTIDRETLGRSYTEDRSIKHPLRLFVHGDPYQFWGLWTSDLHLFGFGDGASIFLLGTDRMGRDMLSRFLYGMRISLSVGLLGVLFSLALGAVLGGASGYYGGSVDWTLQRLIELLRSFPSIPLWMALSAAFPADWSPVRVYFVITIVLSLIGWTDLARVVRGKLLSLRSEDFCTAGIIAGASDVQVIFRHMIPSFLSHIIVATTLQIPGMILAETALSFLGIGLRAPAISWGVLLQEAQNIRSVAFYPWLLIPTIGVVGVVLAFNFIGDGLRDAADPYT